jgi:hypothetical protein
VEARWTNPPLELPAQVDAVRAALRDRLDRAEAFG